MIWIVVLIVLIRIAIIAALIAVIYRQIRLYNYEAPREVTRLKRLLIWITASMLTINIIAAAQTIIGLSVDNDFLFSIGQIGDVVYVTTRLIGDIINASIIYLIYKEVKL